MAKSIKIKKEKKMDQLTRNDVYLVTMDCENIIRNLRQEYIQKIKDIVDKQNGLKHKLLKRVCNIINLTYLKNIDPKIFTYEECKEDPSHLKRYLDESDEIKYTKDGKYMIFTEHGDYVSNSYVIPIEVICNSELDEKFSKYVEALTSKINLDFLAGRYDRAKIDLEYAENEYNKEKKKFSLELEDILENTEWYHSLDEVITRDGEKLFA